MIFRAHTQNAGGDVLVQYGRLLRCDVPIRYSQGFSVLRLLRVRVPDIERALVEELRPEMCDVRTQSLTEVEDVHLSENVEQGVRGWRPCKDHASFESRKVRLQRFEPVRIGVLKLRAVMYKKSLCEVRWMPFYFDIPNIDFSSMFDILNTHHPSSSSFFCFLASRARRFMEL